tara:strand:- start:545 stop:1042 length:498 start_codon:yes stop_codon:yes gene_type:complete
MNIEIPKQYKDKDFSDDELVFVGLMTALGNYDDFETQYTFCSNDIIRVFGRPNITVACEHLEGMRSIFRIGNVDKYNWTVSWRKTPTGFYNRAMKGSPRTIATHTRILTEMDAKLNWAYLMGKITNIENIIQDWTEYRPNKQGDHCNDPRIIKQNLKGWYPERRF